jgi:hypothetical protein
MVCLSSLKARVERRFSKEVASEDKVQGCHYSHGVRTTTQFLRKIASVKRAVFESWSSFFFHFIFGLFVALPQLRWVGGARHLSRQ